jgi:outer membrane protein TolC
MSDPRRRGPILGLALVLAAGAAPARAEDLQEAWRIALAVDQQLQASRRQSIAAGWDLSASRAQALPRITTANVPAFLTSPVLPSVGTAGTGTAHGGASGSPVVGSDQRNFFISTTAVIQPLYTGGRYRNTNEANRARVNAARADEARTALDLLLDVAGAYVGVLRANRDLEVARTNVANLASQARDVANLVREGRSVRNDLLSTQVALANARQNEVRARNALDNAQAAYNRLLARPLDLVVPLADMAPPPPTEGQAEALVADVAERPTDLAIRDEGEVRALIDRALRARPELAGLSEQARALAFQAVAERAATKPQAAFTVANIYQNSQAIPTQDFGAAAFIVSWTPFDGGVARRRSMALKERECALRHEHADLASRVALQVRQSWLAVQETRRRVEVTRAAVVQSEENLRVTRNRYLQQRAINTEVLDAESLRVQSYNNYFGAAYDAVLADVRLRHDAGDLLRIVPLSAPPARH